jgi:uncharacterized repeat protein (TIGR01451 family)
MLSAKNGKFSIKFGSVLIIYFLVIAGFSGLFVFEKDKINVSASTLYVGGNGSGNYSSIQTAINNASSGDTVYVYSGTYNENVIVNKTINLIGEDRTNTTIVGKIVVNGTNDAVQITVNGVVLRGFTIKNGGNQHLNGGVKLRYAKNCVISDNNLSSNGFSGIILLSSSNNIIKNNIISFNNGTGLMLRYSSAHNTIFNNTIHDNCLSNNPETAGVQILWLSNNNILSGNRIIYHRQNGIATYSSDNNIMKSNLISGNRVGIFFGSTNIGLSIYLNDFINNTKHVNGTSSSRYWNSPIKLSYVFNNTNYTNYLGNYWDVYTGQDKDGDGIGDTPYSLGLSTEKDSYPLVKTTSNYVIIPSSIKVDMVATYTNSTTKKVLVRTQNATLDAAITGDLTGYINFTALELVTVNSSSFKGKGFFKGEWTSNIEGNPYKGTWRGMMFNKSGERKIYMKGTLLGGLQGVTDGYLIESTSKSGTYDVFNSTSTINILGEHITFAKLTLNGTLNLKKPSSKLTEIYILQALFKGNASGYYNKSLSLVLTHVRLHNETHKYYGQGFSTMSYVSTWGSGSGWSYDRLIAKKIVNLTGFFTQPLWGIVFGILNETGAKKTLSITIIRLDLGSAPAPNVAVNVWGPRIASPGMKINYLIAVSNTGLKDALNTEVILTLSNNVTYISNTGYGSYNNTTHQITWQFNISAKSRTLLSTKCKLKWGLTIGSWINCTVDVRDYVKNSTLSSSMWSIRVVVAVDPNAKYGPDGFVTHGQKLNYKIEFENEGKGIAFGVYFTDTLSNYLDDSTLEIGPVISKSNGVMMAPPGIYDPSVRTITWFVGELGPSAGGYTTLSIKVREDAEAGSEIINYATVFFPSAPEITRTNGVVSIVKNNIGPVASAGKDIVVKTNEDIIFDGSGSYDPDGSIISYTWNFGDGRLGNNKVVKHSYSDNGNYLVTLTVTDEFGVMDYHHINVLVLNRPPLAKLEVASKNINKKEITFDASSSIDSDGTVTEYYFDFGDGTNSGWINTPTVAHVFTDVSKLYTIGLSVKDDDGAVNENLAALEISVNDRPIPQLIIDTLEAYTYSEILLSGISSTDPDGKISSYYFDFGDGSNSGWVSTPEVTHQYIDGTRKYTVSLSVKDDLGSLSTSSSSTEILIKNRKPQPSLVIDGMEVYVNDEVVFKASESSDLDGEILEYYFNFGDNTNSGWITESVVKHTYTGITQEFSVELQVKDDDGYIAKTTLSFQVTNRVPYTDAGAEQDSEVGEPVNFNAGNSYDPDGSILTYNWNFGDGTTSEWSSSPEITHSYAKADDYTVTLTVSDGVLKAKDTCVVNVKVNKNDIDTDSDGVPDYMDAFPFDSAASVDTDGDEYPDEWNIGKSATDSETGLTLDAYPDDPDRHKSSKGSEDSLGNIFLVSIIVTILILILVIGIIASFILKNKNKHIPKPFDSNEYIRNVRDRIIQGDVPPDTEISDNDLWTNLQMKYQNSQISEDTYRLLEEEKSQHESSLSFNKE